VRNYDEPTGEEGNEAAEARINFVKYQFVPGMGFYDIGLLHILGNTTNAVTAAWREMLDAGMYANFPGFLMADTGARQNTNIIPRSSWWRRACKNGRHANLASSYAIAV